MIQLRKDWCALRHAAGNGSGGGTRVCVGLERKYIFFQVITLLSSKLKISMSKTQMKIFQNYALPCLKFTNDNV